MNMHNIKSILAKVRYLISVMIKTHQLEKEDIFIFLSIFLNPFHGKNSKLNKSS